MIKKQIELKFADCNRVTLSNFLKCFSWLYTEHRKDRVQKEQKEPEAMMNHKSDEATDYNLKATNPRIMDTPKKTEMMNGIDNTAFESEQL